ncbi:uncharacterized protein [Ptychodera flava]|uniref:uncharacterized protein isoform X2 n=1 Tax=Ptychodera flava TaxID=63121 RepID=UPI00396A0C72
MELGSDSDLKYSDVDVIGTKFSVAYCDIGPKDGPVAVFIHGSPATYRAFKKLFHPLTENGIRMIMPNFPGMGYTKLDDKGIYNFSSYQKAEIIKAFLRTIGIKRVDTLVGFSLGGHIVLRVCSDEKFDCVKSVTLLSSPGGSVHRLVRPLFMARIAGRLLYWLMHIPLIGYFVLHIFKYFYALLDLRGKTLESNIYSAYEGAQLDFELCQRDLISVSQRRLPVLMFHADDDPIVEKEIAKENMEILSISADDVIRYDRNGECTSEKTFQDADLYRAVWFEKGGHRLHISWTDIVSNHIVSMISAVKSMI